MRSPATARKGGGRSLHRWPDGREGQMTNETRGQMMHRHARWLALAVLLVLGACGPGQEAADPTGPTTAASEPSPTPPASEPSPTPPVQDIMELEELRSPRARDLLHRPRLRPLHAPPRGVRGARRGMVTVGRRGQGHRGWARHGEHHHRGEPGAQGCRDHSYGRSTGRTERRRPRCRAGGPGPVPGDVAPGGRDRRTATAGSTWNSTVPDLPVEQGTTSPDASTATSGAGSRPST